MNTVTEQEPEEHTLSLHVRAMPAETMSKLEAIARGQGLSREAYIRELLVRASHAPVVHERYTIKVYGISGKGVMKRRNDELVSTGYNQFNSCEAEAFEKAKDYVQRNHPGDREKAIALLQDAFEEVFVEPLV